MLIKEAESKAKLIAEQIFRGTIDPYDGAMKIWKQILDNLEERIPDDLWVFKSNASAIEDCLWNVQDGGSNNNSLIIQCKNELIEAAKQLTAIGSG